LERVHLADRARSRKPQFSDFIGSPQEQRRGTPLAALAVFGSSARLLYQPALIGLVCGEINATATALHAFMQRLERFAVAAIVNTCAC
jgi:hypothetical protein